MAQGSNPSLSAIILRLPVGRINTYFLHLWLLAAHISRVITQARDTHFLCTVFNFVLIGPPEGPCLSLIQRILLTHSKAEF